MKRILIIGGMILGIAFSATQLSATVGVKLSAGEAEVLYDFMEPGSSPEGIIFDRNGNMFISRRISDGTAYIRNDIIKITPWGETSVLAEFGALPAPDGGLAGLTTDPKGNVYAAFNTSDANHGVWKICPDGEMTLLDGSDQLIKPNALTFDKQGNLYCTDCDPGGNGGVWRYGKENPTFEFWAGGPLLISEGVNPLGQPMVGANGIVFDPPNHIYVANTQKSIVAHIEVLPDGSAGAVSLLADNYLLMNCDGLALDAHGDVYAVIPTSTFPEWFMSYLGLPPLPPLSPVVRIVTETGEVQPVLDLFLPDEAFFDFPTSLSFGTGPMDKKSVFVVGIGARNYGLPFGTGPKLTQVGVGVPGHTGK